MTSRWASHRREIWRWELLDERDQHVDWLAGVEDGARLEFSVGATVRGSGEAVWHPGDQQVDWATRRLRPWLTVVAAGEVTHHPHSVFLVSPQVTHTASGREVRLTLMDKSIMLSTHLEESRSLPAGTAVMDEVRSLLAGVDAARLAVEDSASALAYPMAWEADGQTTLRTQVNDLLDFAGHFAVAVGSRGEWTAPRYVLPSERGIAWTFEAGPECTFEPVVEVEYDAFTTPSRWVCYSRADGDDEPLRSVAEVVRPDTPLVLTEVETGVEADSQATLDAITRRRLLAATPGRSFTVSSLWVPVAEHERASLVWASQGIATTATVRSRRITCTPGVPVVYRLSEVA